MAHLSRYLVIYADSVIQQFPTTVALTSSMRTTRSSLPVSVVRVRPRVIFPVFVSRSSRSLVSVCSLSGRRRRRSPVRKEFGCGCDGKTRGPCYGKRNRSNELSHEICPIYGLEIIMVQDEWHCRTIVQLLRLILIKRWRHDCFFLWERGPELTFLFLFNRAPVSVLDLVVVRPGIHEIHCTRVLTSSILRSIRIQIAVDVLYLGIVTSYSYCHPYWNHRDLFIKKIAPFSLSFFICLPCPQYD